MADPQGNLKCLDLDLKFQIQDLATNNGLIIIDLDLEAPVQGREEWEDPELEFPAEEDQLATEVAELTVHLYSMLFMAHLLLEQWPVETVSNIFFNY